VVAKQTENYQFWGGAPYSTLSKSEWMKAAPQAQVAESQMWETQGAWELSIWLEVISLKWLQQQWRLPLHDYIMKVLCKDAGELHENNAKNLMLEKNAIARSVTLLDMQVADYLVI
jgi:hypothetical protein